MCNEWWPLGPASSVYLYYGIMFFLVFCIWHVVATLCSHEDWWSFIDHNLHLAFSLWISGAHWPIFKSILVEGHSVTTLSIQYIRRIQLSKAFACIPDCRPSQQWYVPQPRHLLLQKGWGDECNWSSQQSPQLHCSLAWCSYVAGAFQTAISNGSGPVQKQEIDRSVFK